MYVARRCDDMMRCEARAVIARGLLGFLPRDPLGGWAQRSERKQLRFRRDLRSDLAKPRWIARLDLAGAQRAIQGALAGGEFDSTHARQLV